MHMNKAGRNHRAEKLHQRWRPRLLGVAVAVGVGVAAAAAVAAGTPAVIKMAQPSDPEMTPVVFKHWKHQRSYKCYACHPGVFSQWEKAVFDHDAMEAGKYCGTCHNGDVAFVPEDEDCEVCHAE